MSLLLACALVFSPVAPRAAVHPPAVPHVVKPIPLISGLSTWYRWRSGQAAAGPELRRFLGRIWRGSTVRVCALQRCVVVTLTDWCACPSALIDLDRASFATLTSPSRGILQVTVAPV